MIRANDPNHFSMLILIVAIKYLDSFRAFVIKFLFILSLYAGGALIRIRILRNVDL